MAVMTLIDTTPERASLFDSHPDAWEVLRGRSRELADRTTRRALEIAAKPDAPAPVPAVPRRESRLRYVPPVAALGVAAVLQVVAMTDLVGGPVARTLAANPPTAQYAWVGYFAGFLLGCAVASCVEGGAAYLMDLYDKHLLARDSTWALRLGMVVYVGASAGLLHWYLEYRHMPTLVSWVLAGMSGLSLFLWSRGSRWANRREMRAAGQLDPALPKLPMAAKALHPWRSLGVLWVTSWEPVETTEEARRRYAEWRTARRTQTVTAVEAQGLTQTPTSEPETAPDTTPGTADSGAPGDDETAAQRPRQDTRTAQEIEAVVRALALADPAMSRRRIARLASTSATNTRRILGPDQPPGKARAEERESTPTNPTAGVVA
jgi:hypothetical protein